MFLRAALQRCSELEDELASVYGEIENAPDVAVDLAAACAAGARRQRTRAQMLRALAELSKALDDDGPFLVQVPVQLAGLGRTLNTVRAKLASQRDAATAASCADTLRTAPFEELHAALLEVAEPEVRRLLRTIDTETRRLRRRVVDATRSGGTVRTRDAARTRTPCAQQAS